MVYPKLNVQDPGQLWDKITSPEWSSPPITPIECAGYEGYLTPNFDPIEWGLLATMGLVLVIIFVMIVCQIATYLTQQRKRRWVSRLVKAGPEERADILRSWCAELGVSVEGTDLDLDLGEERPLPDTTFGISHAELSKDVEERLWLGFEEGEKMRREL
ncbi:hypothetical protein NA56DRAFT_728969 [Hyaloscypha hepaticicola]|uniref:Uncharacterized protein n=1 Tax=Hyaloscypha hepaticicola TaxID=2082293 RepID=A0A2J6PTN9_9HELO|nr:hypothetical protein NA56DRAFT_728969 [Hyaloscypha hepaticicola]